MRKTRVTIFVLICGCLLISLSGCKIAGVLLQSPLSMVKKQIIFYDEYANPVTYDSMIRQYQFFDEYRSRAWTKEKFSEQWFISGVNYVTKLPIKDELLSEFIMGPGQTGVKDVLAYFKSSLKIGEQRTLTGGVQYIYTDPDKERMEKVVAEIETGNIKNISMSNGFAYLRWITHKFGGAVDEGRVFFVGTYVIADVTIEKTDGTTSSHERLAFFTTFANDDKTRHYLENTPFFGRASTRDNLEDFLNEYSEDTTLDNMIERVGK